MIKLGFLIVVLTGLMVNASDVFEHELKGYPSNLRTCDPVAAELAQKFSEVAKVEIYWAKGNKISETECDIKISYIANERLSLPATVDRDSFSAVEWRGVYPSYADCEKYLEIEKTLFVQEIGLSPWLSYCAPEESVVNKPLYYPVIEAVGNPTKSFFGSDSILGGTPIIGWDAALQELKDGAHNRGIAVASVGGYPFGGSFDLRMRFYTKQRHWLINNKFGSFINPMDCQSQIARLKTTFTKAQIPPIGALCAKDFGAFTLNIVNLTPDIIKSTPLTERIDPKTYSSLDACVEKLDETEKLYTEKFNKRVMGGFCFNSAANIFQVMILEDTFRP